MPEGTLIHWQVNTTRSATFTYDILNRITQANTINTTSGNCWGENYTIDNWGNLTNIAGVASMGSCWTETLNAAPASNANRLNGYCYDAAGNYLLQGTCPTGTFTPTYSYDNENRLSSAAGYNYYYDADGTRMEKQSGSTGTMYWPGIGGEYLTETDLSGNINEEYIYFNGERLARIDRPSGTVHYYFSDQLGSASVITDPKGVVQEQYYYYPFGGMQSSNGSDTNHYKFTGKERDSESGNDYFGARYYASSMGRWLSPDWSAKEEPVPYAKLDNPQSLNLYQYVLNNPLSAADDDGHDIIYITSGPGALKNEQTVRDSVTALLANPNTSGYLQQFVGTAPGTPDLVIQNGDLSAGDSKTTAPDGTPGTSTVQGNTDPNITTDGKSGGPIITIDNRTTAGETPGVLTHESVHAGESQKNPAQFAKDSKAEAGLPHDKRPQEQRANAVQRAQGPAIAKAVKQIEKERKKEQKNQ